MDYLTLDINTQQIISPEQAWHYHIIPKLSNDEAIELYIDEEKFGNNSVKNELEILFGKNIILHKISNEILNTTLGKYYRRVDERRKSKNIKNLGAFQSDDFLFNLINEAQAIGSSDIHIEPYEDKSRIRLRIDGKLIERYVISLAEYPALINKIKIKANLDIAEKRLPQDGRIFFETGNEKFDIRVSVLPTMYGEKAVLRLLSKDTTDIDINRLGFNDIQLRDYLEGTKKTNGIILISGPTGSGKTTTLYATLKILNNIHANILTIEDPIEYTLEGVNQVQVKEDIGLTFASALRTFLRQDPDIIMLGEIRDGETAQMAIRAALTGHLVLSTIHTNSAWGTISRLADMGVPPYLLAGTMNLTVSQRLVRLLCPDCKEKMTFNEDILPKSFKMPYKINSYYSAKGCDKCFYTGYKGRKAVYEVIPVDNELAFHIKNANFDVRSVLDEKNIKSLAMQAFVLVEQGLTTIEEAYPILLSNNY